MVFLGVNTCFYGLGWRWMSVNRSSRSIREVIVCEAEMLSRGIINISCVRSLFLTRLCDWLFLGSRVCYR
jgi:hypothetical protein